MSNDNMKQQLEQEKSNENLQGPEAVGILRRNNRGCKSEDFYNWPEQPLEQMDTPLAVQQYIQQLIYQDPEDIDRILQLPEGQDSGAWKIEHLRLFCMQLNRLAAKLQECCIPETCNQMTATEQWIFLCAAHKQPIECSAIDYTRHTLDGAASMLNSNKYFPSRVTIKESSVAKLSSVCRRVYRIFSHAYYHHFQVFDDFERETHLCKRFSKFVTIYDLMPKDSLIVPPDDSKPEALEQKQEEKTVPSDTTVIDSDTKGNNSVDEVSKKEVNITTSTSKVAETSKANTALVKSETKVKKTSEDETSSSGFVSQPVAVSWSPSQASTNTMIKGSKTDIPGTVSTKKSLDADTNMSGQS